MQVDLHALHEEALYHGQEKLQAHKGSLHGQSERTSHLGNSANLNRPVTQQNCKRRHDNYRDPGGPSVRTDALFLLTPQTSLFHCKLSIPRAFVLLWTLSFLSTFSMRSWQEGSQNELYFQHTSGFMLTQETIWLKDISIQQILSGPFQCFWHWFDAEDIEMNKKWFLSPNWLSIISYHWWSAMCQGLYKYYYHFLQQHSKVDSIFVLQVRSRKFKKVKL